jgi:NifU-like protein involved in Fe-S cluster formation
MYSETLIDHFTRPRHLGELDDANGVGTIGDPSCGDFLRIYIRVEENTIRDISFLCQGCPAAIASGSATTELAAGRTLQAAVQITDIQVSEHLGGMPEEKLHCSNLGVGALRFAIADYLGIRTDTGHDRAPTIERLKAKAHSYADQAGLLSTRIAVTVKRLPPGDAIGEDSRRDYPIWKGKEGVVEATVMGARGQAFTPAPADFEGSLGDLLLLDTEGPLEEPIRNRGILVAAVNALCAHLGITRQTIHCKGDDPERCADDLLRGLARGILGSAKIALIGYQPTMAEALATRYSLRVLDLDPENIGKAVEGFRIEGEDQTDDALGWCDLALVTGSTIVNGTVDRYIGLDVPVFFYGMTISGAAALLNLPRFCPRAWLGAE